MEAPLLAARSRIFRREALALRFRHTGGARRKAGLDSSNSKTVPQQAAVSGKAKARATHRRKTRRSREALTTRLKGRVLGRAWAAAAAASAVAA